MSSFLRIAIRKRHHGDSQLSVDLTIRCMLNVPRVATTNRPYSIVGVCGRSDDRRLGDSRARIRAMD